MDETKASERAEKAKKFFLSGYNCTQAVVMAYSDIIGTDGNFLAKIASPFGGGMGRLREVCGSVSGMFMVLGFIRGYSDPADTDRKKQLYTEVREAASRFQKENGAIVCRELLGLTGKSESATPDARTPEYYKKRPCAELVFSAAKIIGEYLEELGTEI